MDAHTRDNPLLVQWETPFETPPFGAIKPEHFHPAFEEAMAAHRHAVEAIAADPEAPTFANTIVTLEGANRSLDRVSSVFGMLAGAHSNDAILTIERELSPKLAAHGNAVRQNAAVFKRIDALWQSRDALGLTGEQLRVLKRYHTTRRRAGAGLAPPQKQRLAAIVERMAVLGTSFSQNVLADEQAWSLPLDDGDLAGLPDFLRDAAREAAEDRGLAGKYAITLSRSSFEPFVQNSDRRDLREKAFRAFVSRGENGGGTDNRAIVAEMVALRAERAKLLGYESFAHYRLDDEMAKTPEAARGLLEKVWTPARARALADRDAMQEVIRAEGGNFKLAPWDWRYYAEKRRKIECDFDEAEIQPYLSLDNIIAAAFETARRLFGTVFIERDDIPVWHSDVRTWEVRAADGRHLGVFYGDYFARPSKRGGAWMSTLRDQNNLTHEVRPLVTNTMNFAKAAGGAPTLLTFDDARTLFHEFGHGLHGLLSDVTYPMIACTGVATDFVELPSQLYEHWLERPEVLREFALHHQTRAPMPDALLAKLIAARNFGQGFATVEYVASAIVDLDFHSLTDASNVDVGAFEKKSLARIGMPEEIAMRHRPPHFQHVFAGGGYSAAYYSYMWSEVLDADAFEAFEETGDVFDPATAARLKDFIYSAGGKREPDEAYMAFRGRLPTAEALLRKRGLADAAA